jgi:hypothetical protein
MKTTNTDLIVVAYCIYIPVMLGLTVWVAKTIHKNTKAFLMEIFSTNENVASAVNNLLQMGFYLIALGYGYTCLKIKFVASWFSNLSDDEARKLFMTTQKELVEVLASKLGGFTLFTGALLFFNLFLMLMLRKSARNSKLRAQQMQQYMVNMNKPQG